MDFSPLVLRGLIARLLEEDVGYGDITTLATVPPQARGHGRLLAKEALVLAGLDVALAVFHTVDSTIRLDSTVQDGVYLHPGSIIAEIHGPARALLTAERVALNLLQRLSGVATATRRYVESVRHPEPVLLIRARPPQGSVCSKNTRYGLAVGTIIALAWATVYSLKIIILPLLVASPRPLPWHGRPSHTSRKSKWKSKISPNSRKPSPRELTLSCWIT